MTANRETSNARLFQAGTDYISGLVITWNSISSITISAGRFGIPGLNRIYTLPSPLTISGISGLAANTFYHAYVYDNAGTPGVDISTSAPVVYLGTARNKTGDTSRRYIGSALTDASGGIIQFDMVGNKIFYYVNNVGQTPWRVVNAGQATIGTAVSLAATVPVTAKVVSIRGQNGANVAARLSNQKFVGAVGDTGGGSYALTALAAAGLAIYDFPIDNSISLVYWLISASASGGLFVDVTGYVFDR